MTANSRIPSLDGLRAIAILMVVVSHLSGAPGFILLPGFSGTVLGDLGVRIFFVLSGYLITALLLAERETNGTVHLRRFYVRRIFRIAPPFYFFLGVLAIAAGAGAIVLRPGDLWKAALYIIDYCPWDSTSNYVRHLWSLSVEEQFYLLWPVAIWAWPPGKAKWIAVASILLSPIWRITLGYFVADGWLTIDRRFDALSDTLATGCLLALMQEKLLQMPLYMRWLRSPWAHLLPAVALGAAAMEIHPRIALLFGRSIQNVAIALYMSRCIQLAPAWLNRPLLMKIGVISYSIYLWQQVFCPPHSGLPRFWAPLALFLTFSMSWVSFRFIETPFQKLGRKYRSAGVRATAVQESRNRAVLPHDLQ